MGATDRSPSSPETMPDTDSPCWPRTLNHNNPKEERRDD